MIAGCVTEAFSNTCKVLAEDSEDSVVVHSSVMEHCMVAQAVYTGLNPHALTTRFLGGGLPHNIK